MKIKLTYAQWESLVPLVIQGQRAEERLGLPIHLDNGDQQIEIQVEEVKITLTD